MSYQAEYIWIDGTEPSPCCGPRPRSSRRRGAGHLGLRRVVDEPGDRQRLGLRALAGLRVPGPPAGPRRQAGHVRGPPHRLHPHRPTPGPSAWRRPRSTPTKSPGSASSRSTRSSRTGGRTCGPRRGTRTPGPLLLRRRRRQDARPGHRRAPHQGLHGRRARHRGHQRRGDDGPVGVPDRDSRRPRHRRPALGGPLAALPHRRGLRVFATLEPKPVVGDWNGAGPTPTSRPRPCAPRAAGTPSSPGARPWGRT